MAKSTELCPIFKNNLVKRSFYVPYKALASISTTTHFNTQPPIGNGYNVTTIWVRPTTKWPSTTANLKLLVGKAASQLAAMTVFASLMISKTYTVNKWYAMTTTSKAFTASDCLRMKVSSKETNAKGVEVRITASDA
jgi:hypothetical protein